MTVPKDGDVIAKAMRPLLVDLELNFRGRPKALPIDASEETGMTYEEQLEMLNVVVRAKGGQGGATLTLDTHEPPNRRYRIYVKLAGGRWIEQYGPTFEETLASVRRIFEAGDFSG